MPRTGLRPTRDLFSVERRFGSIGRLHGVMTSESLYLVMGAFVVLSAGQYLMRRSVAKASAEQWLQRHGYRAKSLRFAWFSPMTPRGLFRNRDRAIDFIAEVGDTQLGGSGKVRLRVWTNWIGTVGQDVEVDWIQMPANQTFEEDQPLMLRLADAQLDILRRVSAGETSFYAPRSSKPDTGEFDELMEHVAALERRGMLTHAAPVEAASSGRSRYAYVSGLEVTPSGKKWLESQSGTS